MQFKTLREFIKLTQNEADCVAFLEQVRWNGNVISPFDETSKVYKCKRGYKCKNTGKYFNVKVGTIFESSPIKISDWLMAIYLCSCNTKGISSYQLAKRLGITQDSAWFMLHRIRFMFNHPIFKQMMGGIVEVDETYIGGKSGNMHKSKRVGMNGKGKNNPKIGVLAVLNRDGYVIAGTIPETSAGVLKSAINKYVLPTAELVTDSHPAYHGLKSEYNHTVINHNMDEYVKGNKHTNSVEGFFSHLKRTIFGTYHFTSKKHLQAYINEITTRFNIRKMTDSARIELLLSNMECRLTYKQLVA